MYDVNYSVQFFIDKFESIPEEEWCEGSYRNGYNKFCALGHCGEYNDSTSESRGLARILFHSVTDINDGDNPNYKQPTAKQRILAALYDIRDKELSEANVKEASKILNTELEVII